MDEYMLGNDLFVALKESNVIPVESPPVVSVNISAHHEEFTLLVVSYALSKADFKRIAEGLDKLPQAHNPKYKI